MQTTVRMSREHYDESMLNEVIEHVAARTSTACLGGFFEESSCEPAVCETLGFAFMTGGYVDVDFVVNSGRSS